MLERAFGLVVLVVGSGHAREPECLNGKAEL